MRLKYFVRDWNTREWVEISQDTFKFFERWIYPPAFYLDDDYSFLIVVQVEQVDFEFKIEWEKV